MSALPFTDRELRKAWRELKFASQTSSSVRKNPQRLLLFYAVECGLKAVWLKANNKNVLDAKSIDTFKHDLSEIMRALGLGKQYFLPSDIYLNSCTIEKKITRATEKSMHYTKLGAMVAAAQSQLINSAKKNCNK